MNNHLASLPRKTNLASVGGRYGAAIVDFALALLLTLVLYYGGSRLVFQNTLTSLEDELYYYQVQSGLFYKTEDGEVSFYEMDDENPSYLVYAEPVEYYYLNFLTGTNIKEEDGRTLWKAMERNCRTQFCFKFETYCRKFHLLVY